MLSASALPWQPVGNQTASFAATDAQAERNASVGKTDSETDKQ